MLPSGVKYVLPQSCEILEKETDIRGIMGNSQKGQKTCTVRIAKIKCCIIGIIGIQVTGLCIIKNTPR